MSYLSEEENLAALAAQIPEQDQGVFRDFKASRIEASFAGRIFVVYKPTGPGANFAPDVLTTLRLTEFGCDDVVGADFRIEDTVNEESIVVGHVPTRIFDYDLFIAIPPEYRLRWDMRRTPGGNIRSLVYPVTIWTQNRSSNFTPGVTYAETPNRFRTLYPDHKLNLNFK